MSTNFYWIPQGSHLENTILGEEASRAVDGATDAELGIHLFQRHSIGNGQRGYILSAMGWAKLSLVRDIQKGYIPFIMNEYNTMLGEEETSDLLSAVRTAALRGNITVWEGEFF